MKEIDNNQKADSSFEHLDRVTHVDIEGTLKEKLGQDYDSIRKLTISGNINKNEYPCLYLKTP